MLDSLLDSSSLILVSKPLVENTLSLTVKQMMPPDLTILTNSSKRFATHMDVSKNTDTEFYIILIGVKRLHLVKAAKEQLRVVSLLGNIKHFLGKINTIIITKAAFLKLNPNQTCNTNHINNFCLLIFKISEQKLAVLQYLTNYHYRRHKRLPIFDKHLLTHYHFKC
jgi:hypothetical protein